MQLIAETVIDQLNQSTVQKADARLLDLAFDQAIVRGDTALRELVEQECTLPGEWDYVSAFRRHDTQAPPDSDDVYRSLRRRLLVTEENGLWRLRVPLMQRWLRERA